MAGRVVEYWWARYAPQLAARSPNRIPDVGLVVEDVGLVVDIWPRELIASARLPGLPPAVFMSAPHGMMCSTKGGVETSTICAVARLGSAGAVGRSVLIASTSTWARTMVLQRCLLRPCTALATER